jgi:serine/threonine-protein phosphatase CPPED1
MKKIRACPLSVAKYGSAIIFMVLFCIFIFPLIINGKEPDTAAGNAVTKGLSQLGKVTLSDSNDFSFAVFGDNRGSTTVFERLLSRINDDPDILFAVSLGDIIYVGTRERYDFFFSQLDRNLKKPILFVPGNHELMMGGYKLYQAVVGPPYYGFAFGNAYFIVIDNAQGEAMDSLQERQAEKDLAEADGYKETFIFMHQPPYDPPGTGIRHSLSPEVAERYMKIFRGHRISHIFCSHIHGYFQGQWEGMPYTMSGGAGAPLIGKDPAHYFYHYLKVHVQNGATTIETVQVGIEKR